MLTAAARFIDPNELTEADAVRERQIRALELRLVARPSTLAWEELKAAIKGRSPAAVRVIESRKGIG